MVTYDSKVTVRFTDRTMRQLETAARDHKTSQAEIIRRAVDMAVPYLAAEVGYNPYRHALVSEFSQIALAMLIDKHFPEQRDEVLALAHKRLEKHFSSGGRVVALQNEAAEAAE